MSDLHICSYEYCALLGGVAGEKGYVDILSVELQVFRRWAAQTERELRYVAVVKSSGNIVLATIPLIHDDDREVTGETPKCEICPATFEAYTEDAELEFYVSTQDGKVEYSLKTTTARYSDDECLINVVLQGLWEASYWQVKPKSATQN